MRRMIAANLSVMGGLVGGSSAAIDDMRDLVAISNTHLADIVTLNKKHVKPSHGGHAKWSQWQSYFRTQQLHSN